MKKYRIMKRGDTYRIQTSRFGIFWKWAKSQNTGRVFETTCFYNARDSIRATKEHKKKDTGWKIVHEGLENGLVNKKCTNCQTEFNVSGWKSPYCPDCDWKRHV